MIIPELGNLALILALCLAIPLATLPLVGAAKNNSRWMQASRSLAYGQLLFVLLSYAALTYAFITNNFAVKYVAENSNRHLPLFYRITAVWGAHEGSMLLWTLILTLWTAAVARFSRSLPLSFVARVLAVMGMISVGLLLFILSTSSPFISLLPFVPQHGRDLNPLLQDPGLAGHPPMLYMGYVGFSVAFAFAIAALIGGKLDATWARWSRPWTQVAWCFLTLGITLGSWWSYRVLGWGGWWAWDPVENASFMPWLAGTALIHCLSVAEKRDTFKAWTTLMAITTFSLSLLGTFLVRSGVLSSIHAFAIDPTRGLYMLGFLAVVVAGSLCLFAWRAPIFNAKTNFNLLSRETLLLSNNMLLTTAMLTVLIGTIYPLVIDALHAGKISVGPPYFNLVFIPLAFFLFLLMGIGPLVNWQKMKVDKLFKKIMVSLSLALVFTGLSFLLIQYRHHLLALIGCLSAAWISGAVIYDTYQKAKLRGPILTSLKQLPLSHYAMVIAHMGLACLIIGIAISSNYSLEKDIKLLPNDTVTLGQYQFKLLGTAPVNGPNYTGYKAIVNVIHDHHVISQLYPQKHIFITDKTVITTAAIHVGLWRDLYLTLGQPVAQGGWQMRLYNKPLVRFIWLGGIIMFFGGLLALFDRRYRR